MTKPASMPKAPPHAGWPLVVIAGLAILSVAAAVIKGSGLDEYWTIAFTDPSVPLRTAFAAWSLDTGHPVGYYALNRLVAPALPDPIVLRRLTNLAFTAALVAVAWRHRAGGFALLFAAAFLAQPYMLERFAEYRAPYGALAALGIAIIAIRSAWQAETGRATLTMPIVAVIAAMLLDYPVGLAAVALCAAWMVVSVAAGRRQAAIGAAMAGAIGMTVLGLSVANAARFPMIAPRYEQSMAALGRDMAIMLVIAAVPLAAAFAVGAKALVRTWRDRLSPRPDGALATFVLALAFTVAGYLAINFVNHGMIRRQLMALAPLVCAVICVIAERAVRESPRAMALVLANLAVAAVAALFWLGGKQGFDMLGPRLAAAQRACPTLRIYGIPPPEIDGTQGGITNRWAGTADPVELGLRAVATRHGFRLDSSRPRAPDPRCGMVIWSEWMWETALVPADVARRAGVSLSADQLAASRAGLHDHSFFLAIPPPGGITPKI